MRVWAHGSSVSEMVTHRFIITSETRHISTGHTIRYRLNRHVLLRTRDHYQLKQPVGTRIYSLLLYLWPVEAIRPNLNNHVWLNPLVNVILWMRKSDCLDLSTMLEKALPLALSHYHYHHQPGGLDEHHHHHRTNQVSKTPGVRANSDEMHKE